MILEKWKPIEKKANTLVLVEKSISYLDEITERYPFIIDQYRNIYIVDDYVRNLGDFQYNGRRITVFAYEALEKRNLEDTTIVICSDYYKEAYEKLCQIKNVSDNIKEVYYFMNKETEIEETYCRIYQQKELLPIIVFRSGPHASQYVYGMDFSDNARALFEYMLLNGYTRKYQLVWIVKDPAFMDRYFHKMYDEKMLDALGEIVSDDRVLFLSYEWSLTDNQEQRERYYKYLCLAKYFFFTDAYGFVRNARKDQVRIQLWHGCGFKTRTNFTSCEKRYEYNIVIGNTYKRIHEEIYGLRSDQVVITGYPKEDWLFCQDYKKKYKRLGIPMTGKLFFWLPTFRIAGKSMDNLNEYSITSETGLPVINTWEKLTALNEMLKRENAYMLIKLHPFSERQTWEQRDFSNIIHLDNTEMFNEGMQINELLAGADALISDYSSVAVDYLALNRPMAFLLEDVDEYQNSRGFVFDNIKEWLPGKEVYTDEEFFDFVQEVIINKDSTKEKREQIRQKMHAFGDANNSKRVCDMFLNEIYGEINNC